MTKKMARAKTYGSGWHKESLRHSQARRYGHSTIKAPPLKSSNNLPVQVSIIVPSTKAHSKKITPLEYQRRIDETKKFFDKEFGGDTTVEEVGSYYDDGQGKLIKEKGAIVESSMSIPTYNKKIKNVAEYVEKKQKEYEQDTMLISVEGRKYITPRKDYIDDDKETKKERIIVN